MSGIYIPGMEIPDDCLHCPCSDLEYMDCNLMPGSGIGYKKRLDNCPLVPVPEHGRPIDADALMKKAIPLSFSVQKWVQEVDIACARTIIPADKEGE